MKWTEKQQKGSPCRSDPGDQLLGRPTSEPWSQRSFNKAALFFLPRPPPPPAFSLHSSFCLSPSAKPPALQGTGSWFCEGWTGVGVRAEGRKPFLSLPSLPSFWGSLQETSVLTQGPPPAATSLISCAQEASAGRNRTLHDHPTAGTPPAAQLFLRQ